MDPLAPRGSAPKLESAPPFGCTSRQPLGRANGPSGAHFGCASGQNRKDWPQSGRPVSGGEQTEFSSVLALRFSSSPGAPLGDSLWGLVSGAEVPASSGTLGARRDTI